ncbi:hypothetical protein Taro_023999 [Colocasia esculenta]|uniref:CCHC-type domain-containing protein n=1 Tax=Colocasia esculenta TaxID=4460 RepID=A0A843VA13_COLES|nr:hypothetical protein [Colocasia esculenta]
MWCVPLCLHGLWYGIPCEASARSREADSDQVCYWFNGLDRGDPSQLVSEQEISEMANRRDWGGGGDDPEESTQRMIERIWESLTDIRATMDQQAPVPPVVVPPGDGEAVPVAPVPLRVEVPFVAHVPPPMLLAEEPVLQVEKFLRLQPPTYSGGPNPDTAEHCVHEIERVFASMRCPAADRVVLAAYQLRGFALEWWRLKMQTTFAGRTDEAITWMEFLDVFNDTFFPIQVQQVKREQFRILQQGNSSVLEYQMRFMALSRYAPYVVSDNNMMVEYFIRGLRVELQDAIVPLMCRTVEEAAQRAATLERSIWTRQAGESGSGSFRLPQQIVGASKGKAPAGPSSSGFGKWGQKLKQAFKGKGRGWGGRQQLQQGRGRPEVEESQQSTARQPIVPPGYRCYNCNQPGHLIRNCPYVREYGYGRGVQQPQQFQQPQAGRGRGVPQQRGRGRVMAITPAQADASNMIEDCIAHPLEEKSCELVVEVPSGEFLLTSSYIDEAPVLIEGNQMPGRLYAPQLSDYDIILVVPRGMPQALVLLFSFCENLAM